MKPVWKARSLDFDQPLSLPKQMEGAPALITQILGMRGYKDSESIHQLLYPKMAELRDPFTLNGMKKAVERIVSAYKNNEKICIYADFDLDGTSGLALLLRGLQGLGFKNVLFHQPKRLSDGYGFHTSAVDDLKNKNVSLIITVDVGITANQTVNYAKEKGIDVILTDHHLPGEKLPEAFVVVNPNQPTDESGLGYLCGAGVAFYLLRALKREMSDQDLIQENKNDFDLKSVLEFYTIATLTDMVPLVGDNRILVKSGLQKISQTTIPGIRSLLEELGLTGRPLNAQDIAIRFAPKLNALSRMESGILPIDILLCEDDQKAKSYISKVIDNNASRVQLQAEAEQLATGLIEAWKSSPFVFIYSAEFHRGVVGLIATKMTQITNKPCFVGSLDADEGVIVGSARVPSGSETCLVDALGSAEKYLSRFGGHSGAAGFEFHLGQEDYISKSLEKHFKEIEQEIKPIEVWYDLEAQISDLGQSMMNWYEFLGPFGVGFHVPVFRFKGLTLKSKKELKGGHWRLHVEGDSKAIEALMFSPTARQIEIIQSTHSGNYEILGELQWNYFRGKKTIQVLVRDIRHQ